MMTKLCTYLLFRSSTGHNKRTCSKINNEEHHEIQHVVIFDLNIQVYDPFDLDMVCISMFSIIKN